MLQPSVPAPGSKSLITDPAYPFTEAPQNKKGEEQASSRTTLNRVARPSTVPDQTARDKKSGLSFVIVKSAASISVIQGKRYLRELE